MSHSGFDIRLLRAHHVQATISESEKPSQQLFSEGNADIKQKYQGLLLPWEPHRD